MSSRQMPVGAAMVAFAVVLSGSPIQAAPKRSAPPDGSVATDADRATSFKNGIEWGRAAAQADLVHCNETLDRADAIIFGPMAADHARAARYASCLISIRNATYSGHGALVAEVMRCTAEFP